MVNPNPSRKKGNPSSEVQKIEYSKESPYFCERKIEIPKYLEQAVKNGVEIFSNRKVLPFSRKRNQRPCLELHAFQSDGSFYSVQANLDGRFVFSSSLLEREDVNYYVQKVGEKINSKGYNFRYTPLG